MLELPLKTDFTGKVVVVTGAGGVLCGDMARAFAQAGAKVAALDLNEDKVKKLAEELKNLGAEDIEIGRRMVSFHGDKTLLYKTNLACRTALRILKPIYKFEASNPDEVYEKMKANGIPCFPPKRHSRSTPSPIPTVSNIPNS